MLCYGKLVLRYLIVLRQIRVIVVLAGESTEFIDFTVASQGHSYGEFQGLPVKNR
jgi:hypothetical protein